MTLKTIAALIGAGLLACLACGCAGGENSLTSDGAHAAPAGGLTQAQTDTVTAAARQMLADQTAEVHGLKSRAATTGAGFDVCGYVKPAGGQSTPLYVELRETAGVFTAERGQIGATEANLAKVRFQCRGHGDW